MPRFFIDLDGEARDDAGSDFESADEARNAAIVRLGTYLQDHPSFAYDGHWRVDVRDSAKRLVLHVIVATVDAPKRLNLASYDNDLGEADETFQRPTHPLQREH